MYINICANTTEKSVDFIEYLDKENSLSSDFARYLTKESDKFFTTSNERVESDFVINAIDKNCKHLSKDESRFFSITINPSKKEIEHIKYVAEKSVSCMLMADKDNLTEGISRVELENQIIKSLLEQYTMNCMDRYAQNFNRDGIRSNADLVWFGKVEKDRYYKASNNKDVQHNILTLKKMDQIMTKSASRKTKNDKKRFVELQQSLVRESDIIPNGRNDYLRDMMPKMGDNYHIHVIVSRNDKTQTKRLSPLAAAKENHEHVVNGKKCTIGFDRGVYTNQVEKTFDGDFGFKRDSTETFNYFNERKKAIQNKLRIINKIDMENVNINDYQPRLGDAFINDLNEFSIGTKLSKTEIFYLDNLPSLGKIYRPKGNIEKSIRALKKDNIIKNDKNLSDYISFIEQKYLDVEITKGKAKMFEFPKNFSAIAAQVMVDSGYEDMTAEERRDLIEQERSKIESFTNYCDSLYLQELSDEDFENLEIAARINIEAKYPNISFSDRDVLVADEVLVMEEKYYKDRILELPKSKEYIDLNLNHKIKTRELSTADLNNFEMAANIKVGIKNPNLYGKDKNSLVEKEMKKMQSLYNNNRVVILPLYDRYEDINNPNIKVFKGQNLTLNDYNNITIAANIKVFAKHQNPDKKSIDMEVDRMESRYYNEQVVLMPISSNYENLENDRLQISNLSENDYSNLMVAAKIKIEAKYSEMNIHRKSFLIDKEVDRMEQLCCNNKLVLLPHNNDYNKFENSNLCVSSVNNLSSDDYQNMKTAASTKISAQHPALSDKDRETLIDWEVNRMEVQYYNGRVVTLPNEDYYGLQNNDNFTITPVQNLSTEDYNNIITAAKVKIDARYEDVSFKERYKFINREVARVELTYYNGKTILLPSCDNYNDLHDNINIQVTTSNNLTSEDYYNFNLATGIKVNARYSHLSENERASLIDYEVTKIESQYYNGKKIILPCSENYKDFENENLIITSVDNLTVEDYKNLEVAAEIKIEARYHDMPIDERKHFIDWEVTKMESQYYNGRNIVLPSSEEYTSGINPNIKICSFENLTPKEYKNFEVAAKIKIDARCSDMPIAERKELVNWEVTKMESRYYNGRDIILPSSEEYASSINPNIKVCSLDNLKPEEYKNFEVAAKIKIEARYHDMPIDERKHFIDWEVTKMESNYYNGRDIALPYSQSYAHSVNPNINICNFSSLKKDEYNNFEIAAKIKVDTRYSDLTSDERKERINLEVIKMESQYYNGKSVDLPYCEDYSLTLNRKINMSTFKILTSNEYKNFENAAKIKIDTRYSDMPIDERKHLIDLEVTKMESQYYNGNKITLPRGRGYVEFNNKNIVGVSIKNLTVEDYKNFEVAAKIKINTRYSDMPVDGRKQLVSREVAKMESQYYNEKIVTLPLDKGYIISENSNINICGWKNLNKSDYDTVRRAVEIKAANDINSLSGKDRKEFIEWQISKMEYQYLMNGKIVLPHADYGIIDKTKFEIEKSSFEKLRDNVSRMAIGACRNYIMADLPEVKDSYKTYKLGKKGYKIYKLSRDANREILAKKLVSTISKQLATTVLVRGVAKAIPIVNVVSLAVDVVTLFKNRETAIERE